MKNIKSSDIKELAPAILAEIQKSKSVLLCCHPSPDPDSVGSALAMKFAVESLGRKATVIKGDSNIPQEFMHFPGAKDIVTKSFPEVDLSEFDLFISVDSSKPDMISKQIQIVFPLSIRSIVIDHHASNGGYADINLIIPEAPATGQIIYELLSEIGVEITSDMAANLFMAIYADTGGLKYNSTTVKTYEIATFLVKKYPEFSSLITRMENSDTRDVLVFYGAALGSIEVFSGGKFALSAVSNAEITSKNISEESISGSSISRMMNKVAEWNIVGSLTEVLPGQVKCSFRTKNTDVYPVDKLAVSLGGGGHKVAAGATVNGSIEEAKKLIVSKVKELYNL